VALSTVTGSNGFTKSIGGAVLLCDNLFQLCEIAPIRHNKFQTIHAPLIFNHQDSLTFSIKNEMEMIVDMQPYKLHVGSAKINLANFKLKLLTKNENNFKNYITSRVKKIFTLAN
jgi:NAD kinase